MRPGGVGLPIGHALLVAGVAEVHQFPDRILLVGLDGLTAAIERDLDVTEKSQVGIPLCGSDVGRDDRIRPGLPASPISSRRRLASRRLPDPLSS